MALGGKLALLIMVVVSAAQESQLENAAQESQLENAAQESQLESAAQESELLFDEKDASKLGYKTYKCK